MMLMLDEASLLRQLKRELKLIFSLINLPRVGGWRFGLKKLIRTKVEGLVCLLELIMPMWVRIPAV